MLAVKPSVIQYLRPWAEQQSLSWNEGVGYHRHVPVATRHAVRIHTLSALAEFASHQVAQKPLALSESVSHLDMHFISEPWTSATQTYAHISAVWITEGAAGASHGSSAGVVRSGEAPPPCADCGQNRHQVDDRLGAIPGPWELKLRIS